MSTLDSKYCAFTPSKQPVLPPGGFAPLDAAEGAGFAASRWAAHCAAASQLQAETDAALDALNLSAFREIGLFLQSGTRRLQLAWAGSARDAPPGGPRRLPPYTELPAAVVHTATADRSLQLRQLLRHVVTNVSPHVAVLRARECPNLTAAIRSLVSQLLGPNVNTAPACAFHTPHAATS